MFPRAVGGRGGGAKNLKSAGKKQCKTQKILGKKIVKNLYFSVKPRTATTRKTFQKKEKTACRIVQICKSFFKRGVKVFCLHQQTNTSKQTKETNKKVEVVLTKILSLVCWIFFVHLDRMAGKHQVQGMRWVIASFSSRLLT